MLILTGEQEQNEIQLTNCFHFLVSQLDVRDWINKKVVCFVL